MTMLTCFSCQDEFNSIDGDPICLACLEAQDVDHDAPDAPAFVPALNPFVLPDEGATVPFVELMDVAPAKPATKQDRRRARLIAARAARVAAVRAYAGDHYESGRGWDYVVEAWDDARIIEIVAPTWKHMARTDKAAIKRVAVVVHALADVAADIQGA